MKKAILTIAALSIAVSMAHVYPVSAADTEKPVGGLEQMVVTEMEPGIKPMTFSGLSIMSDVPSFYSYGNDYAYRDALKRSNSSERQRLYTELLDRCNALAGNYIDLEINNITYSDGSTDTAAYLPALSQDTEKYSLTTDELSEVYYTFRNEHPEFYWLYNGYSYTYWTSGGKLTYKLNPRIIVEYAEGETRKELDDGEFYYFDLTWDDDSDDMIWYDYFAKGKNVFDRDHFPASHRSTANNFLYELPDVPDANFNKADVAAGELVP